MNSIGMAVLIGLVAVFAMLDSRLLGRLNFEQPLITSAIIGVILGNPQAGLAAGATIELMSMGLVQVGAATPPDMVMGGIIATTFSILTGSDPETAVAIAVPIAVLGQLLGVLFRTIIAGLGHKADAAIARAHSAASLAIGKELLAEKNRLISEVFQKAQDYIDSLPDSEYFALLKDMVKKYAIPGKSGEIRFNKKDLSRLPEGFADEISAIVGAAGGKITVSDKTENIRSGFILDYGGIEENCSVSALINESRESLQDQIQKILFK